MVYETLNKKAAKKDFEEIWDLIADKIVFAPNTKQDEVVGDLYADLVLDDRFVTTKDGKWALKSHLKFDEIQDQYENDDNFETTANLKEVTHITDEEEYSEDQTDNTVPVQGWDEVEHEEFMHDNGDTVDESLKNFDAAKPEEDEQ